MSSNAPALATQRDETSRGLTRTPITGMPLVSVILAVRNEEPYIARALDAVCLQSYPRERLEILVIDGDSLDLTRRIVEGLAVRDPRIRLLDNPERQVTTALNLGLRAAGGSVVVRVDGHCVIPMDYVATCVQMLRDGVADCVGGPVRAEGDTATARAIAIGMSTPFGVGGASFRWAGVQREVDHLPFGAWRREVFDEIGMFDESLVHNQDDELSDRLRRVGGTLVMNPAIGVRYFSRASLAGLWRQYLGYGFWKVRVIRMRGGWPSSPRHLVPATFMIAASLALLAGALARLWILPACVLGAYAAFLTIATARLVATRGDRAAWMTPAVFAVMHVAYGAGFLAALFVRDPASRADRAGHKARAA